LPDIAAALGTEFVTGGRAPLWTALAQTLVDEQKGPLQPLVDGVVVARTAKPQQGETMGFLASLYSALARTGVPAIGVQEAGAGLSAVQPFASNGLSTVDSIDTVPGKLALVVLLAGGERGDYGVEETAKDGIIPPLGDLPS
jgi:hypothetical protein